MTEDEVVADFQRKRARANTRGWPAFILGFVGFAWGGQSLDKPSATWFSLVALFGGVGLMIFGILTVTGNVRCPVCNALPMGSGGGQRMLVLNPDSCLNCGARLR